MERNIRFELKDKESIHKMRELTGATIMSVRIEMVAF